jgi:cytochrome c peroxidase
MSRREGVASTPTAAVGPACALAVGVAVGLSWLGLATGLAACGKDRAAVATGDSQAAARDARPRSDVLLDRDGDVVLPPPAPVPSVPPGRPPFPAMGASWPSAAPVALGELLFFERRLGADGTTRCASCHDPGHGYAGVDARSQNALGKPAPRHTPTLFDLGWAVELGWDGRGPDRITFVMGHVTAQLGVALDDSARRLLESPTYRAHLERAGGTRMPARVAGAALTAYALTRYSPEAPWDRHQRGDGSAVGADVIAGEALFTGKAQCARCHQPPLYSDHDYHRLGLIAEPDDGRGRDDEAAIGAFRTPTLRGAALRQRFFHDGSAASLEDAIDWHVAGGTGQGATADAIDPALVPVRLTEAERGELLAFVRALSPSPWSPPVPPALPEDLP